MRLENGLVVLDQCGFPGNIGDSCAETSRLYVLKRFVTGQVENEKEILSQFITPKGIIRHPDSPWKEDDTSSDQVLPFVVAATKWTEPIPGCLFFSRTGNGDLVTPNLLAVQKRALGKSSWFYDLSILGQSFIFKIPFRWNDEKKWFESSKDSSCDYLNFVMALIQSNESNSITWPIRSAIKRTSKDLVLNKIKQYYLKEPNSENLVSLYSLAIDKIWKAA